MAETEQGTVGEEQWDDVPMGPGQDPPRMPVQIEFGSGEIRRKPGHEHYLVTDLRPERPA